MMDTVEIREVMVGGAVVNEAVSISQVLRKQKLRVREDATGREIQNGTAISGEKQRSPRMKIQSQAWCKLT